MLENKESITSKVCAFARAYHSYFNREKVFDDYLAFDLLGTDEYEYLKELIIQKANNNLDHKGKKKEWSRFLDEYITPIPLSRIAYAEDKLQAFAKENKYCQYVICGAGLDTFAFRNENPNIEIFELDHPNTQEHKIQRIQDLEWVVPRNVHFTPIDFEHHSIDEALIEAGFDPNKKTFFSILGVSYYLTLETLKKTFYRISKISSLGSVIVFDYPDDASWKNSEIQNRVKKLKVLTQELGEVMTDGFNIEELSKALQENDYNVIDHQLPKQIHNKYFYNRKDDLRGFEHVHFVTAEFKKQKEKK